MARLEAGMSDAEDLALVLMRAFETAKVKAQHSSAARGGDAASNFFTPSGAGAGPDREECRMTLRFEDIPAVSPACSLGLTGAIKETARGGDCKGRITVATGQNASRKRAAGLEGGRANPFSQKIAKLSKMRPDDKAGTNVLSEKPCSSETEPDLAVVPAEPHLSVSKMHSAEAAKSCRGQRRCRRGSAFAMPSLSRAASKSKQLDIQPLDSDGDDCSEFPRRDADDKLDTPSWDPSLAVPYETAGSEEKSQQSPASARKIDLLRNANGLSSRESADEQSPATRKANRAKRPAYACKHCGRGFQKKSGGMLKHFRACAQKDQGVMPDQKKGEEEQRSSNEDTTYQGDHCRATPAPDYTYGHSPATALPLSRSGAKTPAGQSCKGDQDFETPATEERAAQLSAGAPLLRRVHFCEEAEEIVLPPEEESLSPSSASLGGGGGSDSRSTECDREGKAKFFDFVIKPPPPVVPSCKSPDVAGTRFNFNTSIYDDSDSQDSFTAAGAQDLLYEEIEKTAAGADLPKPVVSVSSAALLEESKAEGKGEMMGGGAIAEMATEKSQKGVSKEVVPGPSERILQTSDLENAPGLQSSERACEERADAEVQNGINEHEAIESDAESKSSKSMAIKMAHAASGLHAGTGASPVAGANEGADVASSTQSHQSVEMTEQM